MGLTRALRASLGAAAFVACAVPGIAAAQDNAVSEQLRAAVNAEGILQHERAFESFAAGATGNRLSGTPGYDASALYVADRMEAAGCFSRCVMGAVTWTAPI